MIYSPLLKYITIHKPKEAVDSSSPACCNKEKCWIDLSAGKAEAEVQFSVKYGGERL